MRQCYSYIDSFGRTESKDSRALIIFRGSLPRRDRGGERYSEVGSGFLNFPYNRRLLIENGPTWSRERSARADRKETFARARTAPVYKYASARVR